MLGGNITCLGRTKRISALLPVGMPLENLSVVGSEAGDITARGHGKCSTRCSMSLTCGGVVSYGWLSDIGSEERLIHLSTLQTAVLQQRTRE